MSEDLSRATTHKICPNLGPRKSTKKRQVSVFYEQDCYNLQATKSSKNDFCRRCQGSLSIKAHKHAKPGKELAPEA